MNSETLNWAFYDAWVDSYPAGDNWWDFENDIDSLATYCMGTEI